MNKRLLTILGGLAALIIVIIGFIYYVSSKNKSTTPPTDSSQAQNNTGGDSGNSSNSGGNEQSAPPTSTSKVHRISDVTGLAPALSYDSKSIWFFTADGHLYKVNLATGLKQEYLLPQKVIIADAIWPISGDDFIIVSGSGTNKSFYYYDSANKNFITYPQNLKEMDFMPDGSKIAYNWVSGLNSELSIADKQAKNFQNIVSLPSADQTIKVSPSGTRAFTYDKSNPQDGKLNLVDLNAKTVVTIGTSNENSAVWSPDGKHFVYNRADGKTKNNQLWLGDAQAVTNLPLHIEASVSKVAFDKDGSNIYIAAPTVDGLSETVWKVDVASLTKTQLFKPADNDPRINSSNLLVSGDGTELYFKNSDGYVYSIDLGQ